MKYPSPILKAKQKKALEVIAELFVKEAANNPKIKTKLLCLNLHQANMIRVFIEGFYPSIDAQVMIIGKDAVLGGASVRHPLSRAKYYVELTHKETKK